LVGEHVWIFERGVERLQIRRDEFETGVQLTVVQNDEPHAYRFADLPALVTFQSDMEAMLVQTGWSFVEFVPDRRTGKDRRGWPRLLSDRRRWWTDGVRYVTSKAWSKSAK
jgi:hypothetical protein